MNQTQTTPTVKKETKRKIRVEFDDRTPLLERLKLKFFSTFFLQKVVWYLFRLILLIGVSFVILYPHIAKILASVMSREDFVDVTVNLIAKYPALDTYRAIITDNNYWEALFNTFTLSLACALGQTFVCCLIAYGLAKFKFKGNNLVFMLVVFTMIVPHQTLKFSMFMKFKQFDVYGILGLFGAEPIDLINTYWPMIILSLTALAFKNGLFIFMLRQFFKGVPDELEESAYIDGSGTLRTFLQIILPLSIPMLITVFMLSFSWQWTDNFYTNTFFTSARNAPVLMPSIVKIPASLDTEYAGKAMYEQAITGTCGLLIMFPLVIIYLFAQRYLIQGIERSGIVG